MGANLLQMICVILILMFLLKLTHLGNVPHDMLACLCFPTTRLP